MSSSELVDKLEAAYSDNDDDEAIFSNDNSEFEMWYDFSTVSATETLVAAVVEVLVQWEQLKPKVYG